MVGVLVKLLLAIVLVIMLWSGALDKPISDAASWFGDKAGGILTDKFEDTQDEIEREQRQRERQERRKSDR